MTTRDFTANVISASKVVPDGNFKDSKASGVWDINEALDLIKGGNWPNAANINPASFVDALFSCDLWAGSGSARSITNGIDLSTKEGLVWIKKRSGSAQNTLQDTVRGALNHIRSDGDSTAGDAAGTLTAFNSNGFSVGTDDIVNASSSEYVGWTFRSHPKFFDVVKYEGTGSARTVAHSLNTTVGMILIKNLDAGDNWAVYHRGADSSAPEDKYLILNSTNDVADSADWWNDTAPTTSVFTVGTDHAVNASGENYIAYLFAHNNNDGGFGEPGDQDIIKCGSYTGNNSTTGPVIDLGFEPQWLLIRHTANNGNSWHIFDSMRGVATGGSDAFLAPNSAGDEQTTADKVEFNASGFQLKRADGDVNGDGTNYIYVAIRRGGMQTPTAASDVFAIDTVQSSSGTGPAFISGFVIDFLFSRQITATQDWLTNARLLGQNEVKLNSTGTQSTNSAYNWDYMNGAWDPFSASPVFSAWMWKRARGYFDVVVYEGPSTTGNISHNLGVVPEMIWVKNTGATENWAVYHKDLGNTYYLHLNTNAAASNTDGGNFWNSTTPTASVFSVGTGSLTSHYTRTHVASLFATLAGVSKVGSFTQSGATNVACGFSGDTPSLVILKRTDSTGDWYLFDYANGIVSGNDPYNLLNSDAAQVTNADIVDPYSGGFATTSSLTDGDYIFYAIAAVS